MTVQDAIALFAAARMHGLLRVKMGELEFYLDGSAPPLRRDQRRKAEPQNAIDLAIELSKRPRTDSE